MSINTDFEEFIRTGSGVLSDGPSEPETSGCTSAQNDSYVATNAVIANASLRQLDEYAKQTICVERQAVATERQAQAWEDIARSIRELVAMAKEE